jgi:hypothetical protein
MLEWHTGMTNSSPIRRYECRIISWVNKDFIS